jgi:heme/copper-type cytochrome/quinol oxidase subunit 2
MHQDSIKHSDSLEARPLPKWLTDQRDGLNTYQPEIRVMKDDHSLSISVISTGVLIFLIVLVLTIHFHFKKKKSYKK